jgi:nondiscriminating glutamyl-tRNA synthetase
VEKQRSGKMVRVRIAPSPTGYLHVGNLRTALFNYLFAKNKGGKFVLRIEDTDLDRSTKESEKNLMEVMKWCGIDWDEGPDIGGEYKPYRQSERLDIYREYANKLLKEGKAYECYLTNDEIDEYHQKALSEGKPPFYYDREIQKKSKEVEEERKSNGTKPAIRFITKQNEEIIVNDLIKGKVVFQPNTVGDFFLIRQNGMPTYNYAVVIDDALMKITHVIRGDDHLSNTLRQILLYKAFKFDQPEFAHVSMILGSDRQKLSKRTGKTAVEQYREEGYLPEALINYLLLLGWSHPDGKEIMPMEEMIEKFSLDRVSSNPAIFDIDKLRWINSHYVRELPLSDISNRAKPYFKKEGYKINNDEWFERVIDAVRDSVVTLSEFPERARFFFKRDDLEVELTDNQKKAFLHFSELVMEESELTEPKIVELSKKTMKEFSMKGREFYHNLRLILTGSESGVELSKLMPIIGAKEIQLRINQIVK